MKALLFIVLIVGGWLLLQAYILPMFGVKTWLAPQRQVAGEKVEKEKLQSHIDKVQ